MGCQPQKHNVLKYCFLNYWVWGTLYADLFGGKVFFLVQYFFYVVVKIPLNPKARKIDFPYFELK